MLRSDTWLEAMIFPRSQFVTENVHQYGTIGKIDRKGSYIM